MRDLGNEINAIEALRLGQDQLQDYSKDELIQLIIDARPKLDALRDHFWSEHMPSQTKGRRRKWPENVWRAYVNGFWAYCGEHNEFPGWERLGQAAYGASRRLDPAPGAKEFGEHRSKQFLKEMRCRLKMQLAFPMDSEKIERQRADKLE